MKRSKVSQILRNSWNDNLRHNNHAEVQPVPGVPQEGEGADAEATRQDLYQRLKRVNASERVPERKRKRRDGQRFRPRGIKAKSPHKTPPVTYRDHERRRDTNMELRGNVKHIHSPAARVTWMTASRSLMNCWMDIKIPSSGADGERVRDAAFWSGSLFIFLFLVWLSSVYLWVEISFWFVSYLSSHLSLNVHL